VSPEHACWSDEESSRKVKKHRFGKVICADIEKGGGGGDTGKMLKRYVLYPLGARVSKTELKDG
jgi:histone deacetylase 6